MAELTGEAAELAVLLDEIETIRLSAGSRARFFIDAASFYPLNRLSEFLDVPEPKEQP